MNTTCTLEEKKWQKMKVDDGRTGGLTHTRAQNEDGRREGNKMRERGEVRKCSSSVIIFKRLNTHSIWEPQSPNYTKLLVPVLLLGLFWTQPRSLCKYSAAACDRTSHKRSTHAHTASPPGLNEVLFMGLKTDGAEYDLIDKVKLLGCETHPKTLCNDIQEIKKQWWLRQQGKRATQCLWEITRQSSVFIVCCPFEYNKQWSVWYGPMIPIGPYMFKYICLYIYIFYWNGKSPSNSRSTVSFALQQVFVGLSASSTLYLCAHNVPDHTSFPEQHMVTVWARKCQLHPA